MDPLDRMNATSYFLLLLTFSLFAMGLTGCTTQDRMSMRWPGSSEAYTVETRTKETEEAAWAEVARLTPAACNAAQTPPPRGEAIGLTRCVTQLVERHVIPRAVFPDLVERSRAEALVLAEQYARGGLSARQYQRLSMERMKNYRIAWARRAETRNLEAAARLWQGDRKT